MQSLRFKILTPFLLGSLILTIFLSFYTHSSTYKAVEESVRLITKAQTKNVYDSMSLLFRSMGTSVEKMTTDPHVINLFLPSKDGGNKNLSETESWFEIIIQGNEYYRGIMVVDASGVCLASNSRMQVGVSYADRPYVRAALAGELSLSDARVGMVTKNLSATAAAPVYIDGTVQGAVVLMNDFPEIVNYNQKDLDGAQAMFPALLAPDGRFMAHPDKSLTAKGAAFPALYDQLSRYPQGGYVEFQLGGKNYVGYARHESTTGWVIVSSGIESEVYANAWKLSVVVSLVSVAALCVISFVVVRVVNGVLNSLLSLIRYAKTVSEGELALKLADTQREDELGVLHQSLQALVNSMCTMVVQSREASKMKSEFLANMSHEIRTPLNAIIGMAHLYLSENSLPDKKRDYIVKIQIAAKSLLGIINNILDISKIEAGMFELDDIPFSLRESVQQVVAIHQDNAEAKGISLSMEYSPLLPELFMGDPVRIGQVLNNLMGNAVKFTETGSVTLLCVPANGLPLTDGKLRISISVRDTGLGIAPEKLNTLFKPFSQADSSITRKFGGTGLGLAISARIVQIMGGSFCVESEVGAGATFTFTMLLEPAGEKFTGNGDANAEDENFAHLHLEGKRILVAEDNEINQILMEELLRQTGAEVVLAANGLEAVQAMETGSFDLVLMDMQMPVMDGIEAVRRIREMKTPCSIPIVAVTANAMKEDKDLGFEAGLNDYITKPIEPKQLILALKRWLA